MTADSRTPIPAGLLVLLMTWRIIRIVHAFVVTAEIEHSNVVVQQTKLKQAHDVLATLCNVRAVRAPALVIQRAWVRYQMRKAAAVLHSQVVRSTLERLKQLGSHSAGLGGGSMTRTLGTGGGAGATGGPGGRIGATGRTGGAAGTTGRTGGGPSAATGAYLTRSCNASAAVSSARV